MLDIKDLVIDKEFEELLPVLTPDEFENLEKSIIKNGLLDPIKVWQEPETDKWLIIDGHNRYKILKKNHIDWHYWCDYKILYDSDLPTREDVKHWMLEQQLGRRNLSDAERYDIVQKFKSVFEKKAKENQSSGGKGLTNLSKVNTRKEMAKATGVSEGTYQKLDKVMQSDNEEVKQQLRENKISVDKAYQQITHPITEPKEILTPEQKIQEIDNRVNAINKEIDKLNQERKSLVCRRCVMFEGLDIVPVVKYGWTTVGELAFENVQPILWKCEIYMEHEGHKEMFGKYDVFFNEYPSCFWYTTEENRLKDIPEKYRNDFTMAWKQAHDELVKKQEEFEERIRKNAEKQRKAMEDIQRLSAIDDADRVILKKFYRVLATTFHPDSPDGDAEMMRCVNVLKEMWGV